jgi:signal transduction histidine kinase
VSERKWRPGIGLVVLAILLTVMALPLVGLFFFRIYENQFIRQTEAELIAQGSAIAAIYAHELREAGLPLERPGAAVTADPGGAASSRNADERYRPIEPRLDLAVDDVLGPRPDSRPATLDPAFAAIGARLAGVLADTQATTLAGFRLLDPSGTVIAGGGDVGRSFAAIEEVRAALAGGYASALRHRVASRPVPPLYSVSRGTGVRVFVAMPVVIDGRVAGAVYLSRTPNNIVKHLYGERGKVMLAAISVLGATLLIAYLSIRTISRPMHALIQRTERIAAGDPDAIRPLARHGTREMAALSAAFLDMARKLQARSDTIRTFAGHVSHELKSPLTAIQGAAELLRDSGHEMDLEKHRRFLDNIIADADRLNRLVRRLIELARAENPNLAGETSSLAEALKLLPRDGRLSVTLAGGADMRFRMSAENAAIALSNLIDNSARHGAGAFALSAAGKGGTVAIAAADDGDGIAPGNRTRIFEPFFTTRRESGGTGIGLGIVAALVKAHDGTIRLADSARGARFEIELPAA